MNSPTTSALPDETGKARHLIELGLAMDPHARSETLARLIAASLHPGPGSALERFAATGTLVADDALAELGATRVNLARETWIDALGRHIINGERRP